MRVLETLTWNSNRTVDGMPTGLDGQVTVCEIAGVRFAVRENVTMGFAMNSAARWGEKIGRTPAKGRQILELLAPDRHWQFVATEVALRDSLRRPVVRNARFTWRWLDTLRKHLTN